MEKLKRNLSYALILLGGILALYEQSKSDSNQYLIILGLAMLMIGVYRTSRRIPDKKQDSNNEENTNEDI
jgi:hypothetical protein